MNKIESKKSKIHGRGIFATKDIKKEEIVCAIKGPKMFKVNKNIRDALANPDWIGFKVHNWVDPVPPYKYLNHSCNPNTAIKGHTTLIAIKNIKNGTEITVDYSIIEGDGRWHMRCSCGSKNCRKNIRSIKYLDLKLYEKYSPYISKEFRKLYERRKSTN